MVQNPQKDKVNPFLFFWGGEGLFQSQFSRELYLQCGSNEPKNAL